MLLPTLTFSTIPGDAVTDDQLKACAELFTHHYGIWDSKAHEYNAYLKAGARVSMSPHKLRDQFLSSPDQTVLVLCHEGTLLVGHAFATTWDFGYGNVTWVTQLVVHTDYRRRGFATVLLGRLRKDNTSLGLVSSHPAACLALCKAAGIPFHSIDLAYIRAHAPAVIETTPVGYLKAAELRGALFEEESEPGVVSSVFTGFYVDRTEPLEVLKEYQDHWKLGDLSSGHEFFILVKVPPSRGG